MISRKEYMDAPRDEQNGNTLHRAYYAQFVNDNVKGMVRDRIGIKDLLVSKDKHLNDIKLIRWDRCGLPWGVKDTLKAHGEGFSMATQTCILKEAARQIIEENK